VHSGFPVQGGVFPAKMFPFCWKSYMVDLNDMIAAMAVRLIIVLFRSQIVV
jgi:hypothetical protein